MSREISGKCVVIILSTMVLSLSIGAIGMFFYMQVANNYLPEVSVQSCTVEAVKETGDVLTGMSDSVTSTINDLSASVKPYWESTKDYWKSATSGAGKVWKEEESTMGEELKE